MPASPRTRTAGTPVSVDERCATGPVAMNQSLVLVPRARIAKHKQTLTVFGRGDVRRFEGDSVPLARAVLQALRTPKTREELLAVIAETFEGVQQRPQVVLELVQHLEAAGVVGP